MENKLDNSCKAALRQNFCSGSCNRRHKQCRGFSHTCSRPWSNSGKFYKLPKQYCTVQDSHYKRISSIQKALHKPPFCCRRGQKCSMRPWTVVPTLSSAARFPHSWIPVWEQTPAIVLHHDDQSHLAQKPNTVVTSQVVTGLPRSHHKTISSFWILTLICHRRQEKKKQSALFSLHTAGRGPVLSLNYVLNTRDRHCTALRLKSKVPPVVYQRQGTSSRTHKNKIRNYCFCF